MTKTLMTPFDDMQKRILELEELIEEMTQGLTWFEAGTNPSIRAWLNDEEITDTCMALVGSPKPSLAVEGWARVALLDSHGNIFEDANGVVTEIKRGKVRWEIAGK